MTAICFYCGQPMSSQRSTKKYCSDNCKQLAFYRRNGLAIAGMSEEDDVAEMSEEEPALKEPLNDNLSESFTIKDPLPQKDTGQEPPYEWVHSSFLDSIANYVDNHEALFMFQEPARYWGPTILSNIQWLSVRIRCLAESLLILNNRSSIDNQTLEAVYEAFTDLIASRQFKYAPVNYPFKPEIVDIQQKLEAMTKQYKRLRSIRYRLTLKRKVALIGIRFLLADFVPSIKFHELDFTK